jgi:hypothetical protein
VGLEEMTVVKLLEFVKVDEMLSAGNERTKRRNMERTIRFDRFVLKCTL